MGEKPFRQRAQAEDRQKKERPVGCLGTQESTDLTLLPSVGAEREGPLEQ